MAHMTILEMLALKLSSLLYFRNDKLGIIFYSMEIMGILLIYSGKLTHQSPMEKTLHHHENILHSFY